MGMNMDIKVDGNRAMENKKSRPITLIIVLSSILFIGVILGVSIIWGNQGKSVESPFLKVSTPTNEAAKSQKDTVSVYNDNHKEINIKTNNAPIVLK
jgi:hypothetical protein